MYSDEAYLFALVGLLLSFTDCGKTLGLEAPSLDGEEEEELNARGASGGGPGGGGRRGRGAARNQPPDTVPHWHVVLLRFQVTARKEKQMAFVIRTIISPNKQVGSFYLEIISGFFVTAVFVLFD